ncbi:MAG: SH3 domain-containing protein [Candidatus Midichloria sp.]|nr:MAG: SH3 domain-containing protein [Candidatus Midichloria sp.]
MNIIFHLSVTAQAKSELPTPRFVSIKSNKINLRSGPGNSYPIKFIYKFKNYPLEIIAEFEHWRLVKDNEGSQGWVHQSLLSGSRYVLIKDNKLTEKELKFQTLKDQAIIFRLPDETSHPVLMAEIGVVAKVKKCLGNWCQIELEKKRGWIKKINLWGIYEHELFDK